MSATDLKFSLNSFRQLDLPNLLINIWDYADRPDDPICKQYQKWCITAAKEQWQDTFIDFDFVITALKKQNRNWYDFGKISSDERNKICIIISKDNTVSPHWYNKTAWEYTFFKRSL